jgi:hypothetical protein
MLQALRRHPLPMRTRFGHSLVITYALPPAILEPLLPPGLALDTYTAPDGSTHGFVAVGIVSTLGLRPAPLPASLGMDAVLTGYRIFARFPTPTGRTMRGLFILRSDTDRVVLARAGNLLTRYHYHLADVSLTVDGATLTATVDSRDGGADLTVTADLSSRPAPLPPGSPFAAGSPLTPSAPGSPLAPRAAFAAGSPLPPGSPPPPGSPLPQSSPSAHGSPLPHGSASARGSALPSRSPSARGTPVVAGSPFELGSPVPVDAPLAGSYGSGEVLPDCFPGTLHPAKKLISEHGSTRSRSVERGIERGIERGGESSAAAARRFAGPLPYTFDHEAASGSIVVVKARRSAWTPEPVAVQVSRCTFLERGPFAGTVPVLAQAFHVADLDYGWHRGTRRALDGSLR